MANPHGHGHGHGHGPPPGEPPGFFDRPGNVRWFFRIFYAICALLVVADFIAHRHVVHPWEGLPGFYAIYGFLAIVLLVLAAKQLRRMVMRDEDYFDAG